MKEHGHPQIDRYGVEENNGVGTEDVRVNHARARCRFCVEQRREEERERERERKKTSGLDKISEWCQYRQSNSVFFQSTTDCFTRTHTHTSRRSSPRAHNFVMGIGIPPNSIFSSHPHGNGIESLVTYHTRQLIFWLYEYRAVLCPLTINRSESQCQMTIGTYTPSQAKRPLLPWLIGTGSLSLQTD